MTLTARMIDATTGEILVSAKGEGVSKKGGGLKVGGARRRRRRRASA